MDSFKIPLSKILFELATQIEQANRQARQRGEVMQFEECELEFGVSFEKEGEAGLTISVFNFGGKVKKSDTNTIKIKYKAIDGQPKVAAGQAAPGTIPPPVRVKK